MSLNKEYDRQYRDSGRLALSVRLNAQRLRAMALVALGEKCSQCGFADRRALQIDHINGGGCRERRRIGTTGVCRKVIAGEAGYQLLCANCNWIKKFINNEAPARRTCRTQKES